MRNLFIVGAKLLGIVYLFWAISILSQMLIGLGQTYSAAQGAQITMLWPYIISQLFSSFLHFALGFIIVFRTDKIATILRVPEMPLQSESVKPQYIQIGIILIGIYILTTGISEIPKATIQLNKVGFTSFQFMNNSFFSYALKIVLGALLTFGSDKITKLISK